ncbi:MAG: extracellular solute-binding protein [Pseudorhodoferax sp.]
MQRRTLFTAAIGATLLASAGAPAFAADAEPITLRVSNWGGKATQVFIKYAATIYTNKTGNKVQFIDGNSSDHVAKLVAARGRNVPYDVVLLDSDVRANAIKAGVLQKPDFARIPNAKHVYDELKNKDGYGPDFDFVSLALVYNAEKFKQAGIPAPTSWKDLWDPRLAGRVSIPVLDNGAGRAFAIQTARLLGGDESDLTKSVAEIARIKARSYFNTSQDLENQLKAGEVWAAPWADGRAYAIGDQVRTLKAVRPKEGSVSYNSTIDIVAGTPHAEAAHQFINETLGPLLQLGLAIDFYYGPTNRLLAPVIAADAELSGKIIYTIEQVKQLYLPDWNRYWPAHERAVDQWNRVITAR